MTIPAANYSAAILIRRCKAKLQMHLVTEFLLAYLQCIVIRTSVKDVGVNRDICSMNSYFRQ